MKSWKYFLPCMFVIACAGRDSVVARVGQHSLTVGRLAEIVGPAFDVGEYGEDIDTIGGLVFTVTGRIPVRGEIIHPVDAFEFEILDADPRRIKKIRIRERRKAKSTLRGRPRQNSGGAPETASDSEKADAADGDRSAKDTVSNETTKSPQPSGETGPVSSLEFSCRRDNEREASRINICGIVFLSLDFPFAKPSIVCS